MADKWLQTRTPRTPFPFVVEGKWPQPRTPGPTTLDCLPISLIAKILLRLPLTSLPAASRVCNPFHQIIKSPQFSRVYDQQNKSRGCIVTDNSSAGAGAGATLCDPALFFFNISLNQWHKLPISKIFLQEIPLNPRMVSAYGGLVLFTASKKDNSGQPLQERELVVVNPLTRQTRRLPNPPISLSSDNPCKECIEMVSDNSASSYKVIILSFEAPNTVFIYHGSLQYWRSIEIPEILPSEIEPASIISSRGVIYRGILCWLILVDLDASIIIFYDIARDSLIRETLHISAAETHWLCGIAVCEHRLAKISRRAEGVISYPELIVSKLNGVSNEWELDHTARLPALGSDPVCLKMMTGHRTVACSGEEEENMMWAVCLVTEANFIHGRIVLQRHIELFNCDIRRNLWRRLRACDIGEPEEKWPSPVQSLISHRPLSQAKFMSLKFTAAV